MPYYQWRRSLTMYDWNSGRRDTYVRGPAWIVGAFNEDSRLVMGRLCMPAYFAYEQAEIASRGGFYIGIGGKRVREWEDPVTYVLQPGRLLPTVHKLSYAINGRRIGTWIGPLYTPRLGGPVEDGGYDSA